VFGDQIVISIGYMVTLCASIPLGILNMDDNIIFQIVGMIFTLLCVGVWAAQFIWLGLNLELMPAFGAGATASTYLSALPTILFNYGFVATIPSWLNEKKKEVSVTKSIWYSSSLATAQYLIFAVLAALSIDFSSGQDAISMIDGGTVPGIWNISKIMTYVFPIANIFTSIPVFSIIVRYNILQIHGIKVPLWFANFLAVILPWILSIPFFAGSGLSQVINWASAIAFCLLNIIIPTTAYISSFHMQSIGKVPLVVFNDEGEHMLVETIDEFAYPLAAVRGFQDSVQRTKRKELEAGLLSMMRGDSVIEIRQKQESIEKEAIDREFNSANGNNNSKRELDDETLSEQQLIQKDHDEGEEVHPIPLLLRMFVMKDEVRWAWILAFLGVACGVLAFVVQVESVLQNN
jgi:hypothetical protein